MSRTLSGATTGLAARIERADFWEHVNEVSDPNSLYWMDKAAKNLYRLQDVIGENEGRRQTENIEGTWKFICEQVGLLADLAEKQKAEKLPPATRPQLTALMAWLMKRDNCTELRVALGALDKFIVALDVLADAEEQRANEPTYDEIIRDPKLLTPELRAKNFTWWNDYYSDEKVQERLAALNPD